MTFKTPLPEKQYKSEYGTYVNSLDVSKTFDVLIDNVRELREIVREKDLEFPIKRVVLQSEDPLEKNLKETLWNALEDLKKETENEFDSGSENSTPRIYRDNGYNRGLKDAYYTIIKLLP